MYMYTMDERQMARYTENDKHEPDLVDQKYIILKQHIKWEENCLKRKLFHSLESHQSDKAFEIQAEH